MAPPAKNLSTLDLLRAVATVDVVVCHLLTEFGHEHSIVGNAGRLAVLIFFVHTCYVLMLSLERQTAAEPRNVWRQFMLRRVLRIYPLPVALLAAILLFQIPCRMVEGGGFEFPHMRAADVVSNFALTMNLTRSRSLLPQMWSLPYEMQMYLFLPALFLGVQRWRNLRPVFVVWGASIVVSCAVAIVPHAQRLDFVYFVPCFLPGAMAYQWAKKITPRISFAWWPPAIAALVVIFAALPDRGRWPAAWSACLAISFALPFFRESTNKAFRTASHWIAEHSYAFYLTHYFAIWIAFRTNSWDRSFQWAVFAAVLIALAVVAYRCIEYPAIVLGRRLTTTRYAPVLWVEKSVAKSATT